MKNKVILVCLVMLIMAFLVAIDFTNARFYSTASMEGDLDYVKTIGKISIYNPNWIWGYSGADDGSGNFNVPAVPTDFPSIHYSVTNKQNEDINEVEFDYYIRIVAEDGSSEIPIEYDVHEYNTPANVLPLETDVGYGPFTLTKDTESTQYYSIRANWTSRKAVHTTTGVQHLKVQMVKKREDNSLKVISEAPLNMEYTGPEIVDKVSINMAYYLFGASPAQNLGNASIAVTPGTTIDFTNATQLEELGIQIPAGYAFHDVRCALTSWAMASSVTIPTTATEGQYMEVYCTDARVIVQFDYYESKSPANVLITGTAQSLHIEKGTTINFKDSVSLAGLGITIPAGYEFYTTTCSALDPSWAGHDSYTIPADLSATNITMNVILTKATTTKKTILKMNKGGTSLGEVEIESDADGNFIFTKESVRALNSAWAGNNSFQICIQNGR